MIARSRSLAGFVIALGIAGLAHVGTAETLIGLTDDNGLVRIEVAPSLRVGAVSITGLDLGDYVVSIDTRPATGGLYGFGFHANVGHLYLINPLSGAAQKIGGDISLPQATGASTGFTYALDFNPVSDTLRVVSDTRDNFRVDPDTGAVAAVDIALTAGKQIVAIAHSNNHVGAIQTTLFGLDFLSDKLVRIGGVNGSPSPAGGVVSDVGSTGVLSACFYEGLEIGPQGTAYASLCVGSGDTRLYEIDLVTGTATLLGAFSVVVRDIAVASVRGDVNGDGASDISDIFYLINFLFAGGPPPVI